jgi:hypothetical protein
VLLLADDSEAGTAYPSSAGKFNPGFCGVIFNIEFKILLPQGYVTFSDFDYPV